MPIFWVTVRGVFRDRVFQGILMTSLIFPLIPAIGSLSMRQVTELSITLSLSVISFILLLLAVFLGGTSLWKDIERRYTYSVVGLPISRWAYVMGKFGGISGFVFLTAFLLGAVTFGVIIFAQGIYPPSRPVSWEYLALAIFFDALKYILLVAISFLFSSISTSFFLPIFGTISTFFVGCASQQVYDFVHSPAGRNLPELVKNASSVLYYLLPNFSAFDLKVNAVYAIGPDVQGLLLTVLYWVVYTLSVIFVAAMLFSQRELQ